MDPLSSSFIARRVNSTTFVMIEDDSWHERPHIYAVLHPVLPVLILSDTGCDSPREKGLSVTRLREFLETVAVTANDDQPLNPGPNRRRYIVLCTHCHYDHIGGIERFTAQHQTWMYGRQAQSTSPSIVASAHGQDFIEHNLPEHSICKYMGIPTPRYTVSHWAGDFERLSYPLKQPSCQQISSDYTMNMEASQYLPPRQTTDFNDYGTEVSHGRDQDLGITIIQTPGHTPDELAWYDHSQHHLYVGDSFYEEGEDDMPIYFPKDGDWTDYTVSMRKLLDFVREENRRCAEIEQEDADGWVPVANKMVKIACGHTTTSVDAETALEDLLKLFEGILAGRVPVVRSEEKRGEVYDMWREEGEHVRFSVKAPRRLCENARRKMQLDGQALVATKESMPGISGLFNRLRVMSENLVPTA